MKSNWIFFNIELFLFVENNPSLDILLERNLRKFSQPKHLFQSFQFSNVSIRSNACYLVILISLEHMKTADHCIDCNLGATGSIVDPN